MAGTKGRSARGEVVDFDILAIKAKLENVNKPVEVKEREDFIASKNKRKRSPKKKVDVVAEESVEEGTEVTSTVEEEKE